MANVPCDERRSVDQNTLSTPSSFLFSDKKKFLGKKKKKRIPKWQNTKAKKKKKLKKKIPQSQNRKELN
jgi:hypothetical protein